MAQPEELLEFVTYEELEKAEAAFRKATSKNYVSELVYVLYENNLTM